MTLSLGDEKVAKVAPTELEGGVGASKRGASGRPGVLAGANFSYRL